MKNNVLILGFICLIILGISMISYSLDSDNSGRSASAEKYGGDAYTGIQQASATAANNVDRENDNFLFYIRCNGIFYIIIGIMGTVYSAANKSKKVV